MTSIPIALIILLAAAFLAASGISHSATTSSMNVHVYTQLELPYMVDTSTVHVVYTCTRSANVPHVRVHTLRMYDLSVFWRGATN